MRFAALLILMFLGAFTSTALAADVALASDPSLSETARAIFDAVMHSQWWAAAAYGVVFALIGVRKVLPASWKEGVKGDVVGTVAAFVLASAGAVATVATAPGATLTLAVALTALKIGVAAVGGYTVIHKVVGWLAAWDKLPAWVLSALRLVAMLVGSDAAKKAAAAGAAAVALNPPVGLAADTAVREVE